MLMALPCARFRSDAPPDETASQIERFVRGHPRALDCPVVDLAKLLAPSMPREGAASTLPNLQEIGHEHFRRRS